MLSAGGEGVRLLTWGDPYLTAWLAAVRGDLLTDEDYRAAGLTPSDDSLVATNWPAAT